jgi:hypothetical protein
MTEKDEAAPAPDSLFGRFKELARKLVSVPKAEVDAKERALKRKKARKKRHSA